MLNSHVVLLLFHNKTPSVGKRKLKLWDIRKWIVIEDILNMEWENGSWLVVEIYHLVLHMGMGNKTPSVGKEKQKIMSH